MITNSQTLKLIFLRSVLLSGLVPAFLCQPGGPPSPAKNGTAQIPLSLKFIGTHQQNRIILVRFWDRKASLSPGKGGRCGCLENHPKSRFSETCGEKLPRPRFTVSGIAHFCPGVSRDMIRRVLRIIQKSKRVECLGPGPGATWQKKGNTAKRVKKRAMSCLKNTTHPPLQCFVTRILRPGGRERLDANSENQIDSLPNARR